MINNYILPVTSSITSSFISGANYRFDQFLKTQNSFFFRGVMQQFSVNQTLNMLGKALVATGRALPSSKIQNVMLVAPIALGIAAGRQFSNRYIRKVCEFAHDHLGLLCRAVTLVSIGVLLFNGQVLFASCYIGWMALESCCRRYSCISAVPQKIVKIASIVGACAAFIVGNWSERFMISLFIIDSIASRYIVVKERSQIKSSLEYHEKEEKAIKEFNSSKVMPYSDVLIWNAEKYSVNKEVLLTEILPSVSADENPNKIIEEINGLDNEVFLNLAGRPKESVILLLRSIFESSQKMELNNRTRFDYYLRYVASRLPMLRENDRLTVIHDLISKTKGTQSLENHFAMVAMSFYQVLEHDPSLPLRERILVYLQKRRHQIFYEIFQFPSYKEIFGCHLGELFGLRRDCLFRPWQGSKLPILFCSKVSNVLMADSFFKADSFEFEFEKDTQFLVARKREVMDWCRQWCYYQKSPLREKLLGSLSENAVGPISVFPHYREFNKEIMDFRFFAAMLFEMGVLNPK